MSISPDLQFALQVSSMAAFAIPVAGPILGVTLQTISYMLSSPPASPMTPAQVQNVVSEALNASDLAISDANVQTAVEQFSGYVGPGYKFTVDIPSNLNKADSTDPGYIFYQMLTSWIIGATTGSSILLNEINALEPTLESSASPTYGSSEVMNFNGFLRAVSFYLVVYKAWAIFGEMGGAPFNSNQCSVVKSQLQGWLNSSQTLSNSIPNQISARLAQVTPATPATKSFDWSIFGTPPPSQFLVYFADNGGPVPGLDTSGYTNDASNVAPSGNNVIGSRWGDDPNTIAEVASDQQDYINNRLTPALIQNYGNFDQTNTAAVLGNWSVMAQELDYMLAHGGLSPEKG